MKNKGFVLILLIITIIIVVKGFITAGFNKIDYILLAIIMLLSSIIIYAQKNKRL